MNAAGSVASKRPVGYRERTMRGWIPKGLLVLATVVATPSVASADARVSVRLTDHEGRPVDGSVTLVSQGATRSCRTTASRCTITAPAGTYTVTLRPVRGSAPPARTLRVPSSGTLSVALTAGPPRIRNRSAEGGTLQTARPSAPTTATSPTRPTTTPRRGTTVRRVVRPRVTTPRATSMRRTTTASTGVRRTTLGTNTVRRTTSNTTSSDDTERTGTSTGEEPATVSRTRAVAAGSLIQVTVRDLSSGDRLVVQGRVLDSAGRPVDATITVKRGDEVIGRVSTTASRFSIYDLDAGTYDAIVRSARGDTRRSRITVGSETSRVTLRVP